MKRSVARYLILACAGALLGSCGIERPDLADGRNVLVLQALDTSGVYGVDTMAVASARIEITSPTFVFKHEYETDDEGRIVIKGLPNADYYIQASKRDEVNNVLLTGQRRQELRSEMQVEDTLFMSFVPMSPIVLNEIYFCGCNAAAFYYYDQFVELYNSTNDTIYLDGYVMCRSTQVDNLMDWEAVDYAVAYYVYQFPGERGVTRQCPFAPHDFLVIASDAIDHHRYGSLCMDLSNADYEFFNAAANDYDVLTVPNLTPLTTTGNEFSYNIGHCALWLATGEEYEFQEHCYMSGTSQICSPYVHIPLNTILDAVEYSANPGSPRYMTIRLDAGLGGNGITRYSGWSMERKVPGFDSNNSAFDFENIPRPTPGYSHTRM
jgi:hypothetical protein